MIQESGKSKEKDYHLIALSLQTSNYGPLVTASLKQGRATEINWWVKVNPHTGKHEPWIYPSIDIDALRAKGLIRKRYFVAFYTESKLAHYQRFTRWVF